MVCVSLVILWHVSFMLTSVGRRPRAGGIRIQTPTLSVVDTSVLLCGDGTVDLFHRLDYESDMVFLTHRLKERACGGVVRS